MTHCNVDQQGDRFHYHPFEIAITGYSNSGKTTLLSKILSMLSESYSIGFIKNDANKFEMDHEGKDTYKAWHSGASSVVIRSSKKHAMITSGDIDFIRQRTMMLSSDIALVEGRKHVPIEKMILIDEKQEILRELREGTIQNSIAFIGQEQSMKDLPQALPYFHRDDVVGIASFILERLHARARDVPLYGLVLAGGYSQRMQQDKAMIQYYGKTQVEVCYDILSKFCGQVFVSKRREQWDSQTFPSLQKLSDTFLNIGPLGGILTAMMAYPQAAWLVVACDMPFLDSDTVQELVTQRHSFKFATSFASPHDGCPEPLCTIFEPKMRPQFLTALGLGYQCPKRILRHLPVHLLQPSKAQALENINHAEEYQQAKSVIGGNAIV